MNYTEHYCRIYAVGGAEAVRAQMNADINEVVDYGDGYETVRDIAEIVKAAQQYEI